MNPRPALRLIAAVSLLCMTGTALGQETIHSRLNDTALRVQATEDAGEKRAILGGDLEAMTRALDLAARSPLTSARDEVGLERVRNSLQEKSDELAGVNGFERVPDDRLNAFSSYVVQDLEQADRTVTISTVTLLLIVIIVLLVV